MEHKEQHEREFTLDDNSFSIQNTIQNQFTKFLASTEKEEK